MNSEQKLKGALGNIERRSLAGSSVYNEFHERPVEFKFDKTVLPSLAIYYGHKIRLEIRLSSIYTTFKGDDNTIMEATERNAMRALCRVLYQDVLDDLTPIMQAIGDGKRRRALELLNDLYVRLDGREL